MPNSRANYADYEKFNTSQKEFKIIKDLADDSRMFLVKKGNDGEGDTRGNTVLVKLDLSALSKADLNILSATPDTIALLNEIIEEVGSDPKDWIPVFREKILN